MKALLVFLYLFGARVSEALKLKRENFWVEGKYLAVEIPLSKKRKNKGPTIPTHILRVNINSPFMEILLKFLENKEMNEKLWSFSRIKVWRTIKKFLSNCSPHFFRHSRLRKLAEKGATELHLMDWAGWSDTRPASEYIKLSGRFARQFADEVE
jgi:site-specific recombinase XerD